MATLKIIHTADWQLGKPFGRFPQEVRSALAEARLDAIDRLGAAAISSGATHIVVAGDVFDNVEPGDRIVTQMLSRMQRASVTWWLMPGNHDHARAGGLWSRCGRCVRACTDAWQPVRADTQPTLLGRRCGPV